MKNNLLNAGLICGLFSLNSGAVFAHTGGSGCHDLEDAIDAGSPHASVVAAGDLHEKLAAALNQAHADGKTGLQNHSWATLVDRNGIVCAIAKTTSDNNIWLGSRVISAQKANTALDYSTNTFALATANIWAAVQPGGSLYGLQHSNPVNPAIAYGDNSVSAGGADSTTPPAYGDANDPMVGQYPGGVNVFGGGLALYDQNGTLIGGLGTSGDTSCADHVYTWRTRDYLDLDQLPGGLTNGHDNIIYDLVSTNPGKTNSGFDSLVSASGFGHPVCGFGADTVGATLPTTNPVE